MPDDPTNPDAMTDEELNCRVAIDVMKWKPIDRRGMGWGDGPQVWATGEDPDDPGSSPSFQSFNPAENIAHAWLVEEELFRRGLHRQYVAALSGIVKMWEQGDNVGLWCAVHATPRQRCLAALALDPAAKGFTHVG